MPHVARDPRRAFEIALGRDTGSEGSSPESRPVFIFHDLTLAEFRRATDLAAAVHELGQGELKDGEVWPMIDEVTSFVRGQLSGWRNIIGEDGLPIPFAPDSIEDVVNLEGLFDLIRRIPNAGKTSMDITPLEPPTPGGREMECPVCVGEGCEACGHSGRVKIVSGP